LTDSDDGVQKWVSTLNDQSPKSNIKLQRFLEKHETGEVQINSKKLLQIIKMNSKWVWDTIAGYSHDELKEVEKSNPRLFLVEKSLKSVWA